MALTIAIKVDDQTRAALASVNNNIDNVAQHGKSADKAFAQASASVQQLAKSTTPAVERTAALRKEMSSQDTAKYTAEVKRAATAIDEVKTATTRLIPATITVQIDDQTQAGFASIRVAVDSITRQGKSVQSVVGDAKTSVQALMQAINPTIARVGALNKEFGSKAVDGYSADIVRLKKNIDDVGPASGKAGASLSDWFHGMNAFSSVTEMFGQIRQGISSLAEGGSRSMKDLDDAFNNVGKAVVELTNDPQFAKFISEIAGGINEHVVPAIAKIPELWRATQDLISKNITSTAELFGLFPKGATKAIDEMRRIQDQADALEKKRADTAHADAEIDDVLAAEKEKRRTIRESDELRQISNQQTLQSMADDEVKRIKALNAAGKSSTEDRAASAARLERIFERMREAEDEARQKEADEQADAAAQEEKAAAEAQAAERRRTDEQTEVHRTALAKRQELYRAAMEERKALAQQEAERASKASAAQMGNVVHLARNLNPREIAKNVGKQREDAAWQTFREDHAQEIQEAKAIGKDSPQYKALERKAKRIGDAANLQGRKAVFQGTAGENEIFEAQRQLVSKVADQGAASGKLSRNQAAAIKDAVNVLARQESEAQQAAQEIDEIRQVLSELLKRPPSTRKAQKSGFGGQR